MCAFEKQGVQFKVISPDMYEDVLDFLATHFFPAAPVFRSLGVRRDWLLDLIFLAAFRHSSSLAAIDTMGTILAVRVGKIKTRESWSSWLLDQVLQAFPYRLFGSLLPPLLQNMPVIQELLQKVDFNVWNKFHSLKCQSVYEVR